LGLRFDELTRRALFNGFSQSHELIYALICAHVTPSLKVVHRRGADRARNRVCIIQHRELNDHTVEVVALDDASLQRHCKFFLAEDVIVPRSRVDFIFIFK
jgi:hypothetical protein